ncbi:MAG: hypothetical protein JJU03_03820 [Idiomarina sp.]|nr:hypothetical protein [Idiomarina sp.]
MNTASANKNTINLYTDALRPPREYLSLANLGWAILLVIIIVLLWRAQLAWQIHTLAQQRATTQVELTQVQGRITELAQRQREQQIDAQTEAAVARLEREIQGLQSLSSAVLQSGTIEDDNYARLLRDLSAIHQPGLWLSHIENRQGRLILRGQTEHSGHLPRWMARFDSVVSLQGKQFAVVALERDDSSILSFELRSQREQSTQGGGQ